MKGFLKMKVTYLTLAAAFAATTTGPFAETGVKITQIDNVANVYGRAGVLNVRIAGPVVTRPAEAVPAGSTIEPGPAAVAVGTGSSDVSSVLGRS
jgi:hypothetical protein